MFLVNFTIALASYYVIWLSLVSDYGIFWGCEEIIEFYYRCCDCDRAIPSLGKSIAVFSLPNSKELHQSKSIYVFPCSVQVIVYFY